MMRNANKIICQQKAEIDGLTYKLECLLCHATGSRLSKSTYSLRTMEIAVTDYIEERCREAEVETEADAIRKFAELLKEKRGLYGEIWDEDIDKLVKEMVGDNNVENAVR